MPEEKASLAITSWGGHIRANRVWPGCAPRPHAGSAALSGTHQGPSTTTAKCLNTRSQPSRPPTMPSGALFPAPIIVLRSHRNLIQACRMDGYMNEHTKAASRNADRASSLHLRDTPSVSRKHMEWPPEHSPSLPQPLLPGNDETPPIFRNKDRVNPPSSLAARWHLLLK